MSPDNPFATLSNLPYELPPFDRIAPSDYRPAFIEGMRAQLAETAAIAHAAPPPSFENTIVALERSGRLLERVGTVFFNLASANSDAAILQLESELAPQLAAHEDAIYLDAALFGRVDALWRQRAQLQLDGESQQLLKRYHVRFVRAGARLAETDKAQLRHYNAELSSLTTQFRQNVLTATREGAVVVERAAELRGLGAEQIEAAREAARARGLTGRWLLTLQNTTTQPVLAQLEDRALRERIYRASIARASAGACDNAPLIARILRLRAMRASLLGYPTHAAYVLADETAQDPATALGLLRQLGAAALADARREAADIQRLIDTQAAAAELPSFSLQPWDWAYYGEQVRRQRYAFDSGQVRPYFELERVLRDGVFYTAQEMYGLSFRERHDLPVYQSEVRVFEVFDADGAPLALYLLDCYARDNKQGGAWMDNLVDQSKLFDSRAVVLNVLNIQPPPPGQPTLLSFEEVTTLFHEFGHALHGMLSNVRYPLLSGTNVPRDFVEYPSQFNEMWAREPAVVEHFARHYESGAPLPPALLAQVLAAQTFNQGYLTCEYIATALIDLAWHDRALADMPEAAQIQEFEAAALRRHGFDGAAVPPRYHSQYCLHIFAGGYDAGYYAYIWSEVLARDTGQWLHSRGGLCRANGAALRAGILERGRSEDPQILFRDFYGGPPDIAPLLAYRALQLPPDQAASARRSDS